MWRLDLNGLLLETPLVCKQRVENRQDTQTPGAKWKKASGLLAIWKHCRENGAQNAPPFLGIQDKKRKEEPHVNEAV